MAEEKVSIIYTVVDKASKVIDGIKYSMLGVAASAQGAQKEAEALKKDFEALGNVGKTLAIGAGAISASLGFVGLALLKASGQMEQWKIAFTTMVGSEALADNLLKKLMEFAKITPFNAADVIEYSKRLLAMGFAADEIIPTMTNLGNIAAGVGTEKLPQLVLALGQVRAASKLTGMELRQFTEAGVPLLEELAKGMGKTTQEVQKMISEGAVKFKDVEKALKSMSGEGGRFFELMEKQSQSLTGKWVNLGDATNQLAAKFGDYLAPMAKVVVDGLSKLVSWFSNLSDETKKVITITTSLVFIASSLATGFGILLAALPALTAGFVALGISANAAFLGIPAAIGALTFLAVRISENFNSIKSLFHEFSIFLIDVQAKALIGMQKLIKMYNEFAMARHMPIIEIDIGQYLIGLKDLKTAHEQSIKDITAIMAEDKIGKQSKANLDKMLAEIEKNAQKIRKSGKDSTDYEIEQLERLAKKNVLAHEEQSALIKKITDLKIAKSKEYANSHQSDQDKIEKDSHQALENILRDTELKAKEMEKIGKDSTDFRIAELKRFQSQNKLVAEDQKKLAIEIVNLEIKLNKEKDDKIILTIKSRLKSIADIQKMSNNEQATAQLSALEEFKRIYGERSNVVEFIENQKLIIQEKYNTESLQRQQEHNRKMIDIGRGLVTDFQGTINKAAEDLMFNEKTGFVNKITSGISGLFGSVSGLVSGPIGSIVVGGISSIVASIFGSGSKTVAQEAAEKFEIMTRKMQASLDKIGQEKTTAEKQIDILKKLSSQIGSNAIIPEKFLASLGVASGTTVQQGLQTVLTRLSEINKAPSAAIEAEIAKADARRVAIAAEVNYVKALAEKQRRTEEEEAILRRYLQGGFYRELLVEDEALSQLNQKLRAQVESTSVFTLEQILEGLNIRQELVDVGVSPGFAEGGIVAGNQPFGDNMLVRANSGEMILTRSQQKNLFDIANGGIGGGGGLNAGQIADAIDNALSQRVYLIMSNDGTELAKLTYNKQNDLLRRGQLSPR